MDSVGSSIGRSVEERITSSARLRYSCMSAMHPCDAHRASSRAQKACEMVESWASHQFKSSFPLAKSSASKLISACPSSMGQPFAPSPSEAVLSAGITRTSKMPGCSAIARRTLSLHRWSHSSTV